MDFLINVQDNTLGGIIVFELQQPDQWSECFVLYHAELLQKCWLTLQK